MAVTRRLALDLQVAGGGVLGRGTGGVPWPLPSRGKAVAFAAPLFSLHT